MFEHLIKRKLSVAGWAVGAFTAIAIIVIAASFRTPGKDDCRPAMLGDFIHVAHSITLCASEAYEERGAEGRQGCSARSLIPKVMYEIDIVDEIESVWLSPEWVDVVMVRGQNEPLVAFKVQGNRQCECGVIVMFPDLQYDVVSSVPQGFLLIYGE